jgi:hypothetical protein
MRIANGDEQVRSRLIRGLGAILCAAVVLQTLWLWSETGRAGFTKFHDPSVPVGAVQSSDPLDDILAQSGIEDDTGPMPERPNRFQLGLLPGGADRHAMSVLTIGGPAALAGAWLLVSALLPCQRQRPAGT